MDSYAALFISSTAVVLAIILLSVFISRFRSLKRAATFKNIDSYITTVLSLVERFNKALDFDSGYFMKKDYENLLTEASPFVDKLNHVNSRVRHKHPHAAAIDKLLQYCADPNLRIKRNQKFKKHELDIYGYLFDDINGMSLDAQQRDAVITDEYSNLVIAGAGSGKTLTVVGKIKYLTERWGIDPAEILVTSFTRKSVGELQERISKAGIEGVGTKTFHAFGLGCIDRAGVANDNELKNCIKRYLTGAITNNPQQIQAYLEFYGCYSLVPQDYSEYGSEGERYEDLKAMDLKTIKGRFESVAHERKGVRDTLQGERVNSIEELMIANYLFLNGIAYEYEKNYTGTYEKEGRAYQVDFYLPDYDIWLEHFGINKEGRAPWLKNQFEENKYVEGIVWKREIHKKNGTRLIESYSFWNDDQDLLNKIEKLLIENGVTPKLDASRLRELYLELKEDDKFSTSMINLIMSFIYLFKANNTTVEEVGDEAREVYKGAGYMWYRYNLFMSFTKPIIASYHDILEKKNQRDFDDMINHATKTIAEQGITDKYKYIIVDEYQDISVSRFGLIHAVRESTGAKLMCVGDDWQSIYRFAGSDVTLFTGFSNFVGFYEELKIENTYRNSQNLIDIASKFIEKNENQIQKKMVSQKRRKNPVVVLQSKTYDESLILALDSILASRENYDGKILVLGRHNFDLKNIFPEADNNGKWTHSPAGIGFKKDRSTGDIQLDYKGYQNIIYMSVHRAKGLEADDVIVLNLTNDLYGFPNKVVNDPILELLLAGSDNYPYAEERRLMYVALTRTKNQVYLIVPSLSEYKSESTFVKELIIDNQDGVAVYREEGEGSPVKCPRCGEGVLVIRKNNQSGKEFLGCSNYPFCEKTYPSIEILKDQVKCPSCGGWMIKRAGQYGSFYGCANYPKCTRKINIESTDEMQYVHVGMRSKPNRAIGPKKSHQKRTYAGGRTDSRYRCPSCGSAMVKRSGPHGDFYGCSKYPNCRGIRNIK